jgi:hypothetical protein
MPILTFSYHCCDLRKPGARYRRFTAKIALIRQLNSRAQQMLHVCLAATTDAKRRTAHIERDEVEYWQLWKVLPENQAQKIGL